MAEPGMTYWLGRTARELREQQGVTMLDVASRAGVSETAVSRFEGGKGWRRRTDEIVAAYARELDLEPADIWQRAVDASRRSR